MALSLQSAGISILGGLAGLLDPFSNLQECTWRGINIIADTITCTPVAAIHLHQYPYRQYPNPEDLQSITEYIDVRGKVVADTTSSAASIYGANELALYKASVLQNQVAGIFIHPSRGRLTAYCLSCSFGYNKDELGAINIALRLVLVDPNQQSINAPRPNTQWTLQGFVNNAFSSLTQGFNSAVSGFLSSDIGIGVGAAITAAGYVADAITICSDGGSAVNSTKGLGYILDDTVTLGRYSTGGIIQAPDALSSVDTTQPVAQIIQDGTAALRAAYVTNLQTLNSDNQTLQSIATSLGSSTIGAFCNAVQTVMQDVANATNDPVDKIRVLTTVAQQQQISALTGALETSYLIQWTALAVLANVISTYQPTSSTDANNLLAQVTPIFKSAIASAADSHDVTSYRSLKQLFQSVSAYLQSIAVNLPPLVTFELPTPLPAVVVSQYLYATGLRSDDLVLRVNPRHPLFFNTTFTALSV